MIGLVLDKKGDSFMNLSSPLRASAALALCLLLGLPALPQTNGGYGNIGPSKGEVVGAIVGAAAALTAVGFIIYHETHKHPSITGCVAPGADGLTLKNEKDKKVYALSGDSAALKAGERVTLKGTKINGSIEKPSFQVEKLTRDYGVCTP
jgi:hypothetical protein